MNRPHDPPNDPIFLAYFDLYMSYRALIAIVARLRVPPDEFAGQVEDWRRAHLTLGTEQTRTLVQDAHERFRDSIAHVIGGDGALAAREDWAVISIWKPSVIRDDDRPLRRRGSCP